MYVPLWQGRRRLDDLSDVISSVSIAKTWIIKFGMGKLFDQCKKITKWSYTKIETDQRRALNGCLHSAWWCNLGDFSYQRRKEVITVSATRRTRCKIIKSGYRWQGLISCYKIPTTAWQSYWISLLNGSSIQGLLLICLYINISLCESAMQFYGRQQENCTQFISLLHLHNSVFNTQRRSNLILCSSTGTDVHCLKTVISLSAILRQQAKSHKYWDWTVEVACVFSKMWIMPVEIP